MTRHYTKQIESDKWPVNVCPKIWKQVEKATELANTCYVEGSGDGLFLAGLLPPSANVASNVPTPDVGNAASNVPAPDVVVEDLLVDNLIAQMPIPRVVEQSPLPSSGFLTASQEMLNQAYTSQGSQTSSSTIRPGELAQKLKAMKNQKVVELEQRKQAILASRRE
ncbi:transposon mutator sub-class [Hordeum vulgare]|nr:transposon mutator sub-class [Hordeum vulgare]